MDNHQFKRVISQKLDDLRTLQSNAQHGCETVTLDQTRVGRLSRMDAMQSQAMNQEAQRRRTAEIQRLETALARIGAADYGLCEGCDEPISQGRLLLDPAARYCIECAAKREQN